MTTTDDSARVAEARSRALQRLSRQRGTLRPLGVVIIIAVAVGTASSHPAPAVHGKGIAVALALLMFCATLAVAIRDPFTGFTIEAQATLITVMGAAGVALTGLQPRATGLAGAAAVWMAVARLPVVLGAAVGGATTLGIAIAAALAGGSAASVVANVLLCALLGLIAYFISQARDSQERTEILLAQLEDARDEQARAAAIAERGRIAAELHDVLAHSLSGAAIQLQGARKLAERERSAPAVQTAIDRASELVKDGLANARQAVGALRGDDLPTVDQLWGLVDSYRTDMNVDVTLTIDGEARLLPPDASLALYRGAQEALTNVARYAPGAATCVELRYEDGTTRLSVENGVGSGQGLPGIGGGRGLDGMRERIERAGGSAHAGPTETGWRVARGAGVIRVVIADDQRVVRDGLTMLVGLIDGVEVVGAAADGVEAVELAGRERPDVVLMDLRMPYMEGAEATRRIRSELPDTQVLVLTTYADDEFLFPALQAGARGYLTKDASAEEIEHAIRALVAGQTHLDPAVQQRLLSAVLDSQAPAAEPHELPDELTPREAEVLKLIAAGLSNAEIADTLVVSAATVKTHVNRIFYKTGARDRAQAVRYAYQHGIA